MMKIFLNYTQTISILNNLKLNWSDIIKNTFGIVVTSSGNINQDFGLDCLLNVQKYSKNSFYIKTLIAILFPAFFCICVILFWFFRFRARKSKFRDIMSNILITIAISLFFFQSPLINQLTQFLKCMTLGNDVYVDSFSIEKCTSVKYLLWKNSLVIPIFCFYSVVLPIIAFGYMFYNRQNL